MRKSILFENVTMQFGDRKLCENITINLVPEAIANTGGIIGLVGGSGIGKTSLVRLLVDASFKDTVLMSGDVCFNENLKIALLPQKPILIENGTVRENLLLFSRVKARANWLRPSGIEDFISPCKLSHLMDRNDISTLSGGEIQRVMLVRTLSLAPDILILDEPLVGIDAQSKKVIVEILNDLVESQNLVVIFISHSYADIRACCDHILFFERDGTDKLLVAEEPLNMKKFVRKPPTLKAAHFVGYPYVAEIVLDEHPIHSSGDYVILGDRTKVGEGDNALAFKLIRRAGDSLIFKSAKGEIVNLPDHIARDIEPGEEIKLDTKHGFAYVEGDKQKLDWSFP